MIFNEVSKFLRGMLGFTIVDFIIHSEAVDNGISRGSVNSHEDMGNRQRAQEEHQTGEEKAVDVILEVVRVSNNAVSDEGGSEGNNNLSQESENSSETVDGTESKGVSQEEVESIFSSLTEVLTSHSNLDVGVSADELQGLFEATNEAAAASNAEVNLIISTEWVVVLNFLGDVFKNELDNFNSGDDERSQSDGSHVIETSLDTGPDSARLNVASSLVEVPEADRTTNDELRERNSKSVVPEQSNNVISKHNNSFSTPLDIRSREVVLVGNEGIHGKDVNSNDNPEDVEGSVSDQEKGRNKEDALFIFKIFSSSLHDSNSKVDSGSEAADEDQRDEGNKDTDTSDDVEPNGVHTNQSLRSDAFKISAQSIFNADEAESSPDDEPDDK